jgi:pyridoxine/pyridoxamine 5'-phosphate oxidase
MAGREPSTQLSAFSSPGASAVEWERARRELEGAELYWLSSVRADGRPHVTPLLGVWLDDAFCFATGSTERKAKNLAANARCIVTTGRNVLDGLDIVVEGTATGVDDAADLRAIAATFETKYGAHFAAGGTWAGLGDAIRERQVGVWRVAPKVAFGFAKGASYGETRWRFT